MRSHLALDTASPDILRKHRRSDLPATPRTDSILGRLPPSQDRLACESWAMGNRPPCEEMQVQRVRHADDDGMGRMVRIEPRSIGEYTWPTRLQTENQP